MSSVNARRVTHQRLLREMDALEKNAERGEKELAAGFRPLLDEELTIAHYDPTTVRIHGKTSFEGDICAYGKSKDMPPPPINSRSASCKRRKERPDRPPPGLYNCQTTLIFAERRHAPVGGRTARSQEEMPPLGGILSVPANTVELRPELSRPLLQIALGGFREIRHACMGTMKRSSLCGTDASRSVPAVRRSRVIFSICRPKEITSLLGISLH